MNKVALEIENRDLKIQVSNLKNKLKIQEVSHNEEIQKLNKSICDIQKATQAKFDYFFKELHKSNIVIEGLQQELKETRKKLSKANDTINKLSKENKELKDTIEHLKSRINKDSNNSSKPPSSDGLKKKIHSFREKSNKSNGGQFGHKGTTLQMIDNPTNIIEKKPTTCDCGGCVNEHTFLDKKQVVDIQIVVNTNEERIYGGYCNKCGKWNSSHFSSGYVNPVQYGNNIKSLIAILLDEGMVSTDRIKDIVCGITNNLINISKGTIINFRNLLAKKSEPLVECIKLKLIEVGLIHCDETGIKINGSSNWFHTVANEKYSYFKSHNKRGNEATDNIGILAYFVGICMHDHWASYYKYTTMTHAECNAHIIRYAKQVIETFQRKGAREFLDFLVTLNNLKNESISKGISKFDDSFVEESKEKYLEILNNWKAEFQIFEKGKNKEYTKDERCLIDRLIEYSDNHLEFIKNFEVPFDNNLAERALRMIKAKIKISGGFRSEKGAENFAIIRSLIGTAKKQSMNIFQTIRDVFDGKEVVFN